VAVYELRIYDIQVGRMGEVVRLYSDLGWPALETYQEKLVGYFTSDVGALNQLIHLWKFEDDADRRAHWQALYADEDFMNFAGQLRPMILRQANQLMAEAPWGPAP